MKNKDSLDNKDFKIKHFKIKDFKWQNNWTELDTPEERMYELINGTKAFG